MNKRTEQKGIYLSDCQIKRAAQWATDSETAEKLWKLSEELVGEEWEVEGNGNGKESRL